MEMKENLRIALNSELNEYRSIPFWSWNNNLDEAELEKQIEDMKAAGIGGFIIHARTGLKEEYLGEKWFSCVKTCLKKAEDLDMKAWIYDENGWPSGFAGGKLLENEDFRARFLEYSEGAFDDCSYVCYIETAEGYKRITEKQAGVNKYHNIYLRISPANTDILNPHVTDAFINSTHEKYYQRFKKSFGKELAGFFTDEPQYYRWATPYTPYIEDAFKRNGEDVKDGLIWLFKHDERGYAFRQKYYSEMNRLYCENFYGKIHDWCKKHGCKLTGHSVEENTLWAQMWGGAEVMSSYDREDIPAIDNLGRICSSELAVKQAASVAGQLGKKRILTETFGCSGYDVTPYELKSIGDAQYFLGVNMMCQHLYPYSMARGGKTDHPPVFSPQSNWFEGFRIFNDYFTKLSYIISNTEERADIAIIHPIRDIWLNYIRSEDYFSVKKTEDEFSALLLDLRKHGVAYDFIDETVLEIYGKASGGALTVGRKKYTALLIPDMETVSENTYRLLKKYKGKLCVKKMPVYIDGVKAEISLKLNMNYTDVLQLGNKFSCEDGNSFMTARTGEIGDFIFIKNLSYSDFSKVRLNGIADEYRLLELDSVSEKNISDEMTLRPGEGLILIKDDSAKPAEYISRKMTITDNFRITDITPNYLVMDNAQIARGTENFGELRPIYGLFEDLLRENYNGLIKVKQTFFLNNIMRLTFIMEKAELINISVNGINISLKKSSFDINFAEADITDKLVEGVNEIVYSLNFYQHEGVHFALFDPMSTESLKNCLYFDTSVEPSYLCGNFIVNKDCSLSAPESLPELTDKLFEKGYPFFKGTVTLKGTVDKPSDGRVILALRGRFMTAEIKSGNKTMSFVLDDRGDITDLLKTGKNDIEIRINSSLRNLFGPHHFKPESEPFAVNPYVFELRGDWNNVNLPENYTACYNSVPFGVSDIILYIVAEK